MKHSTGSCVTSLAPAGGSILGGSGNYRSLWKKSVTGKGPPSLLAVIT